MQRLSPTEAAVSESEADSLQGDQLDTSIVSEVVEGYETVVQDGEGNTLLHYIPSTIPADTVHQVVELVMQDSDGEQAFHDHYDDSGDVFYCDYSFDKATDDNPSKAEEYGIVAEQVRELVPEVEAGDVDRAFEASRFAHDNTHIAQTEFTGIYVNNNYPTPGQRDVTGLDGFVSFTTAYEVSQYSGGELIFPELGMGFDLRHRDLLAYDASLLHGYADVVPEPEADLDSDTNPGRVTVSPTIHVDDSYRNEY